MLREREDGFPAHAGMDLVELVAQEAIVRLPRTRGDGPVHFAAPA